MILLFKPVSIWSWAELQFVQPYIYISQQTTVFSHFGADGTFRSAFICSYKSSEDVVCSSESCGLVNSIAFFRRTLAGPVWNIHTYIDICLHRVIQQYIYCHAAPQCHYQFSWQSISFSICQKPPQLVFFSSFFVIFSLLVMALDPACVCVCVWIFVRCL